VVCFDCGSKNAFHLILNNKVTFICPDHQANYSKIASGEGEWWTEDLLIAVFSKIESGKNYSDITNEINKQFGTRFSGIQRPGGKGFRGDIPRKIHRLANIEWNDNDSDDKIMDKIMAAYSENRKKMGKNNGNGNKSDKNIGQSSKITDWVQ
jgi:hypothetical protein